MALLTLSDMYSRVAWDDWMSYASTTEYTTTKFLQDVHIIVQDIQSDLAYLREDTQNKEIWYADTVSLQNEYTKPSVTSDNVWAQRVDSVSVCYTYDTYSETWLKKYTPCRLATREEQENWEYHLENQPNDNPIYYHFDKSVFIAPDPRTADIGTNRLKITWVRSLASNTWTTSTTETDIKLPLYFWEVIALGCVWKANARARKDRNIVLDSKNEYAIEKARAIKKMNLEMPSSLEKNRVSDEIII